MIRKILIIEDDKSIAELERDYFVMSGFECDIAVRGTIGLEKALTEDYSLVVIDIMLPGIDGIEILEKLREKKDVPIIMLSARSDDISKVKCLGLGADDYMTKPFSPSELVARVNAHIKRHNSLKNANNEIIKAGKITINKTAHRVFVDGKETVLTGKEYELLLFLAENPNRIFSKEKLYDRIWGFDAIGDISTVAVHIQRVREKTESQNEKHIETVWGVGYRFNS